MRRYLAFGIIVFGAAIAGGILWQSGAYHAIINGTATIGTAMQTETFIDVRTDAEWAAGHVDGALHFDLARLQQGELPDLPKNTPIALYCRTGVRAGEALQILQENGFTNARNAGGLAGLQAQGMRTCPGTESTCGL